jgi:glycosyltransferase involved in cell wall biosynthesis
MTAGGAERQLVTMVQALCGQGLAASQIHVALYSLVADRGQTHFLPDLEALGVTIHDLRTEVIERAFDEKVDVRTALLPAAMRRDVAMLTPLVRRLRPKVLHAWQDRPSLSAGWVAALEMVPRLVLSKRNMTPPKRVGTPVKVDQTALRTLAKLPNTILTVNSTNGARDYEDWLGLPLGDAKVLANGLHVPALAPKRKTKKGGINIHGVFRFSPAKRPLLWLDTVAALQKRSSDQIIPVLYGNGPLEQEITEYAAKIGIKDLRIVTGEKDRSVIYGDADLVLLMSQIEGTPNVLLEAQAEGIAVAGCDVGGTKDAMLGAGVGPQAGSLLFPADITADDAAQQLVQWLPHALKGSRAARHAFVKANFSISALGETVLDLYAQPSKDQS